VSESASLPDAAPAAMSHRQVLQTMSGLLVAMLAGMLTGTIVSTSLPRIVSELGGDQSAFTWVVTATLLAMTVSTPVWGKLADLLDRKTLLMIAMSGFVAGTVLSGLAWSVEALIAFRAFQGLGVGGIMALVQVLLADVISPRERGRYMGFMAAVMGLGTAGGPLLGGIITDSIGWRWNFYVIIPLVVLSFFLIQFTLKLPKRAHRKVKVDYLGAVLIAAGVSLLLVWVTFGGHQFEWNSLPSWLTLGASVLLLALAVLVELRAPEPIIPLGLFRNRSFTFATLAGLAVGVGMFGTAVFVSQYIQLSRGMSPADAGLYTLPQVAATLISSVTVGQIITRTGKWKRWVVTGAIVFTLGLAGMSTVRYDTPLPLLFLWMALLGAGIGMLMQNLVLAIQNTVDISRIGAASATANFFRTLGGAAGVAALGAALTARVSAEIEAGLQRLGIDPGQGGVTGGGALPVLDELPAPVRLVVEQAYGLGLGEIFLIAVPLGVLTIVFAALLPNVALGAKTGLQLRAEREAELATVAAGGHDDRG